MRQISKNLLTSTSQKCGSAAISSTFGERVALVGRNANFDSIPERIWVHEKTWPEMVNSKMKFGLHGIWDRVKFHIAESMRVSAVLVLSLSLGCAASVQAAEAEADDALQPDSTNYPNFQSVVRDQMHASASMSQEARVEPASNWNNLITSVEVAVCIALSFRLFAPRIVKLLDRRLNPVSVAANGLKPQSLKRTR
jgi:hypothetical protein